MQVPEFTVVDFNAGFGGRSLAFRDCGFSVVAAAESDPVKQEILRGIVPVSLFSQSRYHLKIFHRFRAQIF